ncbi:MAG TPA: AzlD domain-containing protein [Firmicutes bacterium]|nr:AzlD domain-containing protein [Bacillota bacterium]
MDGKTFALMLVGMFAVTYASRVLPLMILSKLKMPEWLLNWLGFVPVAVLAALLAPAILMPGGRDHLCLSASNKYLIASIPTLLAAFRTKSLVFPISVGIGVMALLEALN